MSASAFSPISFRSQALPTSYDPAQSFAHTSAYSGVPPTMSTASYGYALQDLVLTKEVIQEGLSDLGRTAGGTKIAFLTLCLSGHGLVDISPLEPYVHIQRLNLSSNNLRDLPILSNLPYLVHLNVSYNKLTAILDFDPPKNLMEANYSHNDIEEMCDLSSHHSLTKLNLDCNQITEINGVLGLRQLTHLSLADNRIEEIANLDHLPLKYLNLSENSIKVIENLETLTQLQVVDLSGNQISSLRGLQDHPFLMEINLEENKVVDIREVKYLEELRLLRSLNLSRNPVEAVADYRPTVLFHLSSLVVLDGQRVTAEEKVAALNRFTPPPESMAAHDHRTNIMRAAHKPARLRFSTLTRVDEPYPMLVLCGPPGSGKGHFAKVLVDEFPSFFGLGVSHTTRPQKPKESHGRDYFFIDDNTFDRAAKSGEFVQTFKRNGFSFGLTMAAIEQVAQQGLACVTHTSIEGVLTLKNTHFEPRYVLTLPLTPQIHEQRLKAKGSYSDAEIKKALQDVHHYKRLHQEKPGFFDTAINTDSLREGYNHLRALVMAYGDISPESPLSLTSASQQTTQQSTTSVTTSERTQPSNSETHTPSLVDPCEVDRAGHDSGQLSPKTMQNMQTVAKAWSRPCSSVPGSRPVSGSDVQRRQGSRTPTSDPGSRRHKQIKAAVAGKESLPYEESTPSGSRPGTRQGIQALTPPPNDHHTLPKQETVQQEEGSSGESSDESTSEHSVSGSSLSKLSSERGFSPEHPSSPHSMD